MNKSEQINELATALSKAQGAIKGAIRDNANPFFKSKYADLASVWDAFREPFTKNGLSLVQLPGLSENKVIVESILMHQSGQWISCESAAVPKDLSPQSVGSTITYLRRYGAQSIAGVCPEDDDGNAASGKVEKPVNPLVELPTKVKNQVHADTLQYLQSGDEHGIRETWIGFDADQRVVLWGMFNSQERSAIKKIMGQMRSVDTGSHIS